jgi:hypothetical protein
MGIFTADATASCDVTGFGATDGTSFAAAYVAAAAAITRDYLTQGFKDSGAADSTAAINPSASMCGLILLLC